MGRFRSARRIALIFLVALCVPATGNAARSADRSTQAFEPTALGLLGGTEGPRVLELRSRAASMRRSLESGGYETRVLTTLRGRGSSLPAHPTLDAPTPGDVARLAGLPGAARLPVAQLESAVRQALRIIGPLGSRSEQAAIVGWLRTLTGNLRSRLRADSTQRSPEFSARALRQAFASVRPENGIEAEAAAGRDVPSAALVLAAALDRTLPVLRSLSNPRAGTAARGCDLVEDLPNLCIGSAADNTYTADAALLIDFGGNDTYLNTAGGAPFPSRDATMSAVSVNIDLAGDDTYRAVSSPSFGVLPGLSEPTSSTMPEFLWPVRVAQGSALYPGVGMLVDLSGDDIYSAQNSADENSLLCAQGCGLGGFGALFDLQGDDAYSMQAFSGSPELASERTIQVTFGQGVGVGYGRDPVFFAAGEGLLLDLGLGDDAYTYDGGSTSLVCDFPCARGPIRAVLAQGVGALGLFSGSTPGVGVLDDDGGADAFSVAASSEWFPGTYIAPSAQVSTMVPVLILVAQGAGIVGTGFLLEGLGNTRYDTRATARGTVLALVLAHGGGNSAVGGGADLDDLGGDDAYEGLIDHRTTLTVALDGDSGNVGVGWPLAGQPTVPYIPIDSFVGQGASLSVAPASVWILDDHSGSDAYTSGIDVDLDVVFDDRRVDASRLVDLRVTSEPVAILAAEGVSMGAGIGGLLDESGAHNRFTAEYGQAVRAEVRTTGTSTPVVRTIASGTRVLAAQGVGSIGMGALMDFGDHSVFDVITRLGATSVPDGEERTRAVWWNAQGSGLLGAGVFFAGGDAPRIRSAPSGPVCATSAASAQQRGFVFWGDCTTPAMLPDVLTEDARGSSVLSTSVGLAPRSGLGRATSLRVTDAAPRTFDRGLLGATAVLMDDAGRALSNTPVHFDLQALTSGSQPTDLYVVWTSIWRVDGITNADGTTTVELPTEVPAEESAAKAWRILATYDGGPDVWPAHAVRPLGA